MEFSNQVDFYEAFLPAKPDLNPITGANSFIHFNFYVSQKFLRHDI